MQPQLRAISDPTRREILRQLAAGEMSAGDVASRFEISRPAISQHLGVLLEAGLVRVRRQAQSRLYRIDVAAVERLRAHFDRFWDDALPRLKAAAESESPGEESLEG